MTTATPTPPAIPISGWIPILVRDDVLRSWSGPLQRPSPRQPKGSTQRAGDLGRFPHRPWTRKSGRRWRPWSRRAFIATHSAWTYFAARYGLEEAGVIHAHPGQEPSSREMANLLGWPGNRGSPAFSSSPSWARWPPGPWPPSCPSPLYLLDPLGGAGPWKVGTGISSSSDSIPAQFVDGLGGSGP